MPVELSIATEIPADADAVAVLLPADGLDGGFLDGAELRRLGFEGNVDQTQVLGAEGRVAIAVGLGDRGAITPTIVRRAGAAAVRAGRRWRRVAIAPFAPGPCDPVVAAAALTEGLLLGAYEFGRHKSKPSSTNLAHVVVVGPEDVAAGVERGRIVADAVIVARDLVNEPGGSLTPKRLARAARRLGDDVGFEVRVLGRREIVRERLGGLLGVNRGSEQPPRFIEAHWRPEGEPTGRLALVGKGITFDTGGVSIKTGPGMMTMKSDMAGAAAVLAAMAAIARLRLPAEVRAYVPCTDNMTGGDATRPGDVLTIRNGKTIEVLNTDAEGRLILADALSLASEAGPDAIIDLATLTGACVTALGGRIAGLMSNHDGWAAQVEQAGRATGEQVWRLPMPPEYRKQLDSTVADMKNIGNGQAGALVAGLLLAEFVGEGIPWAHLDIAGPAFADSEDGENPKGATGYGVRLLVELAERFRPPSALS